jgi:hypothetical protein
MRRMLSQLLSRGAAVFVKNRRQMWKLLSLFFGLQIARLAGVPGGRRYLVTIKGFLWLTYFLFVLFAMTCSE